MKKLLLIAGLSLFSFQVLAQAPTPPSSNVPFCSIGKYIKRETLLNRLKAENKVVPVFAGIVSDKLALEIWRDTIHPETSKWIAFMTDNDGDSCILYGGNTMGYASPDLTFEESPAPPPKEY